MRIALAMAVFVSPLLSHCLADRADPSRSTVASPLSLPCGEGPGTVAAADFNGDGRPDLAVANERSDTVTVYLNGGGRRFSLAPGTPAAGPHPNDIAVGDFNGDGRPDLALANHETQNLTVLLGDGRGRFLEAAFSPIRLAVRPHPHGLAAGDFDGDGDTDLATDSWGDDKLQIVFNPGSPRSPWTRSTYLPAGRHPYQRIRAADLNRDGRADLVSPNLEGNGVSILLAEGKGFRQPPGSPFPSGDAPFGVAVGDVNGDGNPDLAVVNSPSSTADRTGRDSVAVLLGDGAGAFRPVEGSPFPVDKFPNQVAVGDLEGDGVGEVVVSFPESDHLTTFRMSRRGGAPERADLAVKGRPKGIVIADLDGDGKGDLVITANSANGITIIFGR